MVFPIFRHTSYAFDEKKPRASASEEPLSPSASFALGRGLMARGLPRAAESVGVLDGNSYWDLFDGS